MMSIALKFAYDGKKFHGYARQPNLLTVEGELIKGLRKHRIIEDAKQSAFRSASRTDKGVSALCNVVAFNTDSPKSDILNKLSNEFDDIIVYGIAKVEPDFNPRYAKLRQYRYFLKTDGLDIEKIISSANEFTGTHNFSNFSRVESFKDPIRTIDNIVVLTDKNILIIDFFAQTFLWHQIRRIISALEKVGCGKIEKDQIITALEKPDIKIDYGLAPAEPLVLMDIVNVFNFNNDKELVSKFRLFEDEIYFSHIS